MGDFHSPFPPEKNEENVCPVINSNLKKKTQITYMAVGQNQWYHFEIGAAPI